MSDILRAFGISAGMLLLVVVLIVVISFVAVNRGAQEMAGSEHGHAAETPAKEAAVPVAAKPGKAAAAAADEISVPMILIFGTGLFVVAVLALFALSLIEHAG
jgi:hypothetical protein